MRQKALAFILLGIAATFVARATLFAKPVPLSRISVVQAGEGSFGLVLREDGTVLSWGANTGGALGNGTMDPSLTPMQVSDLGSGSGIVALAAGTPFSIALKSDGTVLGWGTNALGALGDGTFTNRLTPVPVSGLGSGSGVIAIATGLSHAVALKADGSVWAWGSNNLGNLGSPSIVGPSNVPVAVSGLGAGSGVVGLTAGGNFSLALKSDGTVWGWGNNNNGQLGIGNTTNQPIPVQVKGPGGAGFLTSVTAVSAPPAVGGRFAVALRSDGTVWAWGSNSNGQLGDGTTVTKTFPVQVKGISGSGFLIDVSGIDAGGGEGNSHGLAVQTDGTVLAWGSNANGQLGTGDNTSSAVPVQVSGLGSGSGVAAVSAATGLSFARKADGSVLAWGDNSGGQLGDGSFFGRTTPAVVAGLGSSVRAISTQITANHSLALQSDGTVLAWGNNSSGQLGIGNTANQRTPVAVPSLTDVVATAVGANHSLAVTSTGSVWAWGDNANGQLGIGTTVNQLTPVQVKTSNTSVLTDVIAVAAARNASYALASDGSVWAWGVNGNGQPDQLFPIQVHGVGNLGILTGVAAVATSGDSAYALTFDQTVLAWGQNAAGQLGDGTTTSRLTPVQVSGLDSGSGVRALAAIASGGAVLKADGTMLAWGFNASGQIGDGTTIQRLTPTQVVGLGVGSGLSGLAAGGGVVSGHTLATRSDGMVLSWGANGSGQLGDGTLSSHLTPLQVAGLASGSGVSAVAGGASHSLALTFGGTVLAWGANGSGQLGDGTVYTKNLTPALVLIDDVTPPAFSSIQLNPTIVGRAAQVTISKNVSDADSGVSSVTASVQGPTPLLSSVGTMTLTRPSGTTFDGIWSGTFTFPTDAADGTFTVFDLAVDGAENESTVTDGTVTLDRTAPGVTVSASPTRLWPPNGKMIPVTVSGTITDAGTDVNVGTAIYAVTDEYGTVQPSGNISLATGGSYVFTIYLEALRNEDDMDGRQYAISISAKDNASNNASSTAQVIVPHRLK